MSLPSGKMCLRRWNHLLVILTLFDLLVKSMERDVLVCGIQPCLFVDGGGGLLQDNAAMNNFFFPIVHNIKDSHANTGSTVIKTLNHGPNKNSPQSQWSLGSNSSQPELDIYNKSDEPVVLLLDADRQQVSYALCLNWFGGNF